MHVLMARQDQDQDQDQDRDQDQDQDLCDSQSLFQHLVSCCVLCPLFQGLVLPTKTATETETLHLLDLCSCPVVHLNVCG